MRALWLSFEILLIAGIAIAQPQSTFEGHGDIGTVLHAGSDVYDDFSGGVYTVTGSGANIWSAEDDFHFVWKRISGDAALSASISFPVAGGDPHRKAVLMIRQNLDPDSAYADAALHGDGLASLQFRTAKGDLTHEIQSRMPAPHSLRIEKRGDLFYLSVAGPNDSLHFSGGSIRVALTDPFYIGIGVSAHNKDEVQKATFRGVQISTEAHPSGTPYSTLETIDVASTDALAVYVGPELIEHPVWSEDGKSLKFMRGGAVYAVPADGGQAQRLSSEVAPSASTGLSPVPSPDGKWVASFSRVNGETVLRVTAQDGKTTKVLAIFDGGVRSKDAPAWSPDSKRIAFVSHQQY